MTFGDYSSHRASAADSCADAVQAPPTACAQPPLRIVHLLAWTLGSAVILALYRVLIDVGEAPIAYQRFWRTLQVVYSMAYGASLCGLLLVVVRQVRGGPAFPVAPGHWLLAVSGLLAVVSWSFYAAIHLLTGAESNVPDYGWYAYYCAGVMAASVLAHAAVYGFGGQRGHWRFYFLAAAALAGVQFLAWWRDASIFSYYTLISSSPWPDLGMDVRRFATAAGASLLLLAISRDWRCGARRDWLHWTGVAVVLCHAAALWAWTVWTWIFPA